MIESEARATRPKKQDSLNSEECFLIQLIQRLFPRHRKISYAQCGEDLVMHYLLCDMLGMARPTYLDLGAHDPIWLSNTYLIYRLGCRGVCVEPNPRACQAIKRIRPRDACVQVGVGVSADKAATFYVMDPPTLSSFSKDFIDANISNPNYQLKEVISTPLLTPSEIIDSYCPAAPNLVSLDVEGHDEAIIKAWDFTRYRPEVFCIETVSHHDRAKVPTITPLLEKAGYTAFADTYINTIYVDTSLLHSWRSRA